MRNFITVALFLLVAILVGITIGLVTGDSPQKVAEEAPASDAETPQNSEPEASDGTTLAEPSPEDATSTPTVGAVTRAPAPPPSPENAQLTNAEAALAGEGSVALLHLDVGVLDQIEEALIGTGDPNALPPFVADPTDFNAALEAKGVDIGKALDHLLIALMLDEAGNPAVVAVGIGEIPLEEIKAVLRDGYTLEHPNGEGSNPIIITRRDPDTCALQDPMALHLEADHFIAGTPKAVESITQRLAKGASAVHDLSSWRTLRASQVLSFSTLVRPDEIAAAAEKGNPMSGAVLAPADQDLSQLSRISGGIRLAALPFQADLRLRLDGDDAAWAQGLDARFQEGKQKVISDYGKDLPSMSLLARTLVSDVTENDITFTLSIDEAAIKTFAALPGEFLKILLGGLGANFSQSGENEPLEERLLEASEVIPYLTKIDAKALPDFNPEDNVFISADAISGPFGIMLRATRISERPLLWIFISILPWSSRQLVHLDIYSGDSVVSSLENTSRVTIWREQFEEKARLQRDVRLLPAHDADQPALHDLPRRRELAGRDLIPSAIQMRVHDQVLMHVQSNHLGVDFADTACEFLHRAPFRLSS